jgi:hypothetical protein
MRAIFATLALTAALSGCGGADDDKKPAGKSADATDSGKGFSDGTGGGTGGATAGTDGGGTGGDTGGGTGGADGGSTGAPVSLTDLQAFQQTVYPLLHDNCAGCHNKIQNPFIAADDAAAALKAIQETGKINFDDTAASRLVKRLSPDNHNCWTTCTDDSATMLAAIEKMQELLKDTTTPPPPKKIETGALQPAAAVDRDKAGDPMTLAMEAEAGTLTAPMVAGTSTNASGGKFLSVPAGNGGAINNANTANIGSAVFTFDVKTAGTYTVWGLVNAKDANSNRFFVRIDAGAFTTWTITANADKFTWNKVAAGATALSAALTVGKHTVEVRRSREGTALDTIALSANAAFDGSQAVFGKLHVLRYDLSQLLNLPESYLEVEVEDFSEAAYKFRNPKLVVPSGKVHAKGLRVEINGVYDPQNATFNLVDQTLAAPGGVLSPAAMVAIKDKGAADDQITFTFDVLEVVP